MLDEATTMTLPAIRKKLDQAIESGDAALARALMAELWFAFPGPACAPIILSGFHTLAQNEESIGATPLKISVLRSFSLEPVIPILKAAAWLNRIDLDVTIGEFNTYAQDIYSPSSPAYLPETDGVILAVQTRDIAPDIWRGEAIDKSRTAEVVSEFQGLIKAFRSHSDAYLVVHNLEQPARAADGILDIQSAISQRQAITEINAGLVREAAQYRGVHILDYDGLVSRHGRAMWSDEERWLTMRLPVSMENLRHLADEWLKFLVPFSGRMAKALIVDLDNTLWGGVLGEEGQDGIQLDGEYPGAAFQAVQRTLLDLSKRGIILGICSKNNEKDVLEALESHPGMIVKPNDFSVIKINWQDKATNINEIAAELNIGTDAIAFFDDNPTERLWVRESLPDVHVIELNDNPLSYADALRDAPVFERLSIVAEDKERSRHFAGQRQRKDLQASVASVEDYYRSLDMKLDVFSVGAQDIPRVAQLTQKTNQFNLTTRRYSEADIARYVDDSDYQVYAARLTDRFGDSGIISVVIVKTEDHTAKLDTFLMSCRVIGRTVETAILAIVAAELNDKGITTLSGCFIPTEKNAPARNFLTDHGFKDEHNEDLVMKLPASTLRVPSWIGS